MISRRTLLIVPIALAVLVGPASGAAVASYRSGVYRTTLPTAGAAKYLDLGFRATRGKVRDVFFRLRTPGKCSDGGALVDNESFYVIHTAPIGRRGGFTYSAVNRATFQPAQFTLQGTLKGSVASGTFRATFDPPGVLRCDTGVLRWRTVRLP